MLLLNFRKLIFLLVIRSVRKEKKPTFERPTLVFFIVKISASLTKEKIARITFNLDKTL